MIWLPRAIITYFTGTVEPNSPVEKTFSNPSNFVFYMVAGLLISSILITKKWL